jgi:hypothetical protein
MRKLVLVGSALAMLGGCSHYVSRQGEAYHEAKAERASARGDYGKAAEHERKAARDAERAASAPLP